LQFNIQIIFHINCIFEKLNQVQELKTDGERERERERERENAMTRCCEEEKVFWAAKLYVQVLWADCINFRLKLRAVDECLS
jgi:hypothetical protein